MYQPSTIWTWALMVITTMQAVLGVAVHVYVFVTFQESFRPGTTILAYKKATLTYLTIFIFGFLYQLVLAYDSLRQKNTIQVIGVCIYNVGILIYASIEYDQIQTAVQYLAGHNHIDDSMKLWTAVQPYLLALLCVIVLFSFALLFVAWKLYYEFAWAIYKHINADLRMRRRLLVFQIYVTLLKFDFFLFLGFTIQVLVIVTGLEDFEKWISICVIPVIILVLFMAHFWVRREKKFGVFMAIACFFGGLAYVTFKVARMYQPGYEESYLLIRKNLTSFAVVTIISIVLTIINASICMANFNKGLQPHIIRQQIGRCEESAIQMTELPGSSRVMLD